MCQPSKQPLAAMPVRVRRTLSGGYMCEFTLALGKAVHKRNGGHGTTLEYPLGRWVADPHAPARWPQHTDHSLHLAPLAAVLAGELNSYGSHRLLILPSQYLSSFEARGADGRCLHDRLAWPVGCLDCGDLELEDVSGPEFNRELALLPPGSEDWPQGTWPFREPLRRHLFIRRTDRPLLPGNAVPVGAWVPTCRK